ncbi:MAG: YciI family protein [Bacteroidota bacterium]
MKDLKDYMLIFRMELNPNFVPSPEQASDMRNAWGGWIGGIAQNARLVSSHQLGFEGKTLASDQSVQAGYVMADKQSISGNLVVKAADMDEATAIAKGCPILTMGGSVEVRNTLAVF